MVDRVGSWAVRAVGHSALLVDAADHDPAVLAARFAEAAWAAEVAGALGATPADIVVGAATVLIVARGPSSLGAIAGVVAGLTVEAVAEPLGADGATEVEIPVRYDGEDLDEVAGLVELTTEEVVDLHSGATYRAAFMGFAPGFAYLAGLPETLVVGRRCQPRSTVPAGSVAIADTYSAVYPRSTPGGWHLLGTTDTVLFDPDRSPPALLTAGARVRFVSEGGRRPPRAEADPATTADTLPVPEGGATIEVVDPGPLTTVQDRGRPGRAAEGVPPSGAADVLSAALANRLVGNRDGAAVLESTMTGPKLRLGGPPGGSRTIAVTGAVAAVTVDGCGQGLNAPFDLHAGQVVAIGPATVGLRSYLAVSGGLDVPAVLGSRSTDLLSGLGPPVLEAGAVLAVGLDEGHRPGVDVAPVAPPGEPPARLRVRLGPRADWLTDDGRLQLVSARWTVASTSNRVGVRLEGPPLERSQGGELQPEGLVTGAVQLTPSDELVVFGSDHPVTGGYPVVAVVDEIDLGVVAQLRPGDPVQLREDRP
ncbi:MAG: 5-oxoprolinase/urea amidolyase family protein [Actinomycetota bacterium]|nr:5-oxoprolinase/urea amidolyase family protein [Actinomycetota bacterium]